MVSRFRSFWQRVKKPLEVFGGIIVCALVIALVVAVFLAYVLKVNVSGLSGKNLWDWLQLLIIPAVLAIGGYLFNFATGRTERDIALDKQREDALQAFIDSMSALLLEKNLRGSEVDAEVRTIARVRTLTVLPRLDGNRKASVVQFLYEASLIDRDKRIVALDGADLSGAELSGSGAKFCEANLVGADLSKANLIGAELTQTDLSSANLSMANLLYAKLTETNLYATNMIRANLNGANLIGTNLRGAFLMESNMQEADLFCANLSDAFLQATNLQGANLSGANLSGAKVTDIQLAKAKSIKGATMPDGSIHS
jgi:uncharacterized protein YjbI with pentapeptide repeats